MHVNQKTYKTHSASKAIPININEKGLNDED
jgi:hypothetical protein